MRTPTLVTTALTSLMLSAGCTGYDHKLAQEGGTDTASWGYTTDDALDQNDLVLELCKGSGTADYISGTGCLDFIRPDTFAQEGITFPFFLR